MFKSVETDLNFSVLRVVVLFEVSSSASVPRINTLEPLICSIENFAFCYCLDGNSPCFYRVKELKKQVNVHRVGIVAVDGACNVNVRYFRTLKRKVNTKIR